MAREPKDPSILQPEPPAWDSIHGLSNTNIADLTRELVSLQQIIKGFNDDVAAKKAEILDLMKRAQQVSVKVGECRVTIAKGKAGAEKISSDELLKNGVTLDIIKKSTVRGPEGQPYLLVTTKVTE